MVPLSLLFSSFSLPYIDREIQGIEIAESQDNEERVDDDAWREEIALERREMEDAYELESESDSETDTPRKIKTTET